MLNLPDDDHPYTTAAAIRACIGLDETDIPDSLIEAAGFGEDLLIDLETWLPTHATVFAGQDAATRHLQRYCAWFGALQLAQMPLAMLQRYTDGKVEAVRFNVDMKAVAAQASQKVESYRALLKNTPVTAPTSSSILGVSTPSYDPVTGAG